MKKLSKLKPVPVLQQQRSRSRTWAELEKHAEQRQALCENLSMLASYLPHTKNHASARAKQQRKEKEAKKKRLKTATANAKSPR